MSRALSATPSMPRWATSAIGIPLWRRSRRPRASKGVTVNTVSPGYIATDMVKSIRQDVLDKIVAGIPVKRLGTPEDIASIVSWVASDESGFATGADFSVNGGLHMG